MSSSCGVMTTPEKIENRDNNQPKAGSNVSRDKFNKYSEMIKRVVVDLDAGTDDAAALLLLLTQECKKVYEVVGITCTHGNTTVDDVCRNVLITLESINRSDVPVFRGAERPLISVHDSKSSIKYFHGKNGFGDKVLPSPKTSIHSENAIPALNRLAEEGISLICLGPLTNIALALRTYSEFSKNVKEVYIMGGNVTGVGNASPSAEFNFFADPEAAHIVLSTLTCPITVLPWESCIRNNMTLEDRFNVDDTLPHMQLLNTIELDLYKGEAFWSPCDALLVAAFLQELMVKRYRKLHLQVELNGHHTRGQGVVNHQNKSPNVTIIEEIDPNIFKEIISKMASFIPHLLMFVEVKTHPQRNSQRGRAINGFNRANDADYDEPEDENNPPRKYGRRGYRSNCRCAKISNCPKLQITIPRCPPEEFVCCFN